MIGNNRLTGKIGRAAYPLLFLFTACAPQSAENISEQPMPMLLYHSYREGNGELYLRRGGDSVDINLTRNPAFDGFGKLSPDGARVLFDSDRAPDGSRDIYVMNIDGSNVTRLTNHPNYDLLPTWSSDGARIAFMSLRNSEWSPQNTGVPFTADIYIMNADGSNMERLTASPAHDQSPTWSPVQDAIVFSREIDGRGQLFSMDLNTREERRLRTSPTYDASPSFSPDGSMLAFYAVSGDTSHIWVLNVDGSGERQVTTVPREHYEPAWSPDGKSLCYTVGVDDQWDIYGIDLATGHEHALVEDPTRDQGCSWGAAAVR